MSWGGLIWLDNNEIIIIQDKMGGPYTAWYKDDESLHVQGNSIKDVMEKLRKLKEQKEAG